MLNSTSRLWRALSRQPVAAAEASGMAADFDLARRIQSRHGKSYYFATRLLPPPARKATFALYAFFRMADEIVDAGAVSSPAELATVQVALDNWRRAWARAYRDGDSPEPVLRATAHVFHTHRIPFEYSDWFLEAMERDLATSSYATFDELKCYMHGSAAVVGYMMAHVIGYSDDSALEYAGTLGYAMQLTNFLRDIDEDYIVRRRVYLPREDLESFGVTVDDINGRRFDDRFRGLIEFQAGRIHDLYDQATPGIRMLNQDGRFPVQVAAVLYRAILDKLEEQEWDVFRGRARTSFAEKVLLTIGAYRKQDV